MTIMIIEHVMKKIELKSRKIIAFKREGKKAEVKNAIKGLERIHRLISKKYKITHKIQQLVQSHYLESK